MNIFIVDLVLPDILDLNFISLIPRQREQVTKLMQKGTLLSYGLAMDRSHAWAIMQAETEDDLDNVLSTFPIIDHVKVRVYPLAFHEMSRPMLPSFSLN